MPTSWSQDEYVRAYRFAAIAHSRQVYRGPPDLPYIFHLSLVSMEVIAALQAEEGHDGDLAVQCSLLHDVVDDDHATLEEIRAEFGEMVASGVSALTKKKDFEKEAAAANRFPVHVYSFAGLNRVVREFMAGWEKYTVLNEKPEGIDFTVALLPFLEY